MGDESKSSLIRTSAVIPPVTAGIWSFFSHPIVEVKLVELKFLSDHSVLLDNNSTWVNSGTRFPKPEWTYGKPSKPISHTKKKEVSVELTFKVYPDNGDSIANCTLTGKADFSTLAFSATGIELKGGDLTVRTTSTNALDDKVQKLTGKIDWSFSAPDGRTFNAGASWGHTLYVTMNAPISMPGLEAGITQKRMEKAIDLVGAVGSNDPHTIVRALMRKIRGYWLNEDPPDSYTGPRPDPTFDYPRYLDKSAPTLGGAWLIADLMDALAECQAIVRFMRAVIKQVGCPGTAQVVVVFSDPDVGNGNTVLEQDIEAPLPAGTSYGYGLNNHPVKTINGKASFPALLDQFPIAVGKVFDRLGKSTTAPYIGPNTFEACMKFADAGTTKYYGGGAGVTDTKEQMIFAFYALCWISEPASPPGQKLVRIENIVKLYRDKNGNVVP